MSFKRHEERIKRSRDSARDVLAQLTDTQVTDLIRRAQHLASDAFTSNSMPEFVTGGRGHQVEDEDGTKATVSLTSVEAQVNQEMFGKPVFDNVAAALRSIDSELHKMALASRTSEHALAFILNVWRKAEDRNLIKLESCGECGKPILERTKRLDGGAFHHPEDQQGENDGRCWWKAYNRTRGRRGVAS